MKNNLCKIGLLGMGNIGTGSYMVLEKEREGIKARTGIDFEFVRILEKFVDRPRPVKVPLEKFTQNPADIFEDPEIDVVVELLGGIHPAVDFMVDAMNHGKHVVAANKAAVADSYELLRDTAEKNRVMFRYEASVGGAIPCLTAIENALLANRYEEVYGILNGTTNYILTKMGDEGLDYETALADFRASDHVQGDVFALLTRLKLICDGAGKLERLCELLVTIFENGESALVFTQYAKVGAWLRTELEARFGRRFPFLHGALSAGEREAEIQRFQASSRPGLFILSLKAGGFGLNLTKATHVIHFDRWWNPAVENQATDRAHRIGQKKTVFVHLFISAGTLEEHVDDILVRKARIADSVITEAEWLEAAKLDE